MSKADFNFDRTQFMAIVDYTSQTGQASSARVTFNASNVTRIYFRKCKERKFMFLEYDSEMIEIKATGCGFPVKFYKSKNQKEWEMYKEQLRKFAAEHRITIEEE